jgi:glycosyltransferase involved in cell wall biosynthesis
VWHLHQDLDVVTFPGQGILTRRTFAALMRAPDALAVLTEKDRRAASALVDPKKIVVLPPASSPDLLTLPLDRPDDDVRVLYVGWLTPAKGIHDLLQVALAVRGREHGSRISFWVLGTGRAAGEAEAVRAFVRRHGLESQVHLCGVVTGEAKRRMFARSHVLMMPTHRDAFPVAVLEGMAAGLPILATNVGGLPYMVEDGRGGYLTDVENVRQMTDRLVELAGDRRQRLTMGRANRERFAAELHPDRLALRALDVYRRVLERSPERVRRSPSRPRPTGPDDVSTPSTWPASTPDITRRG